jgi:hypothetical protein
MTDYAAVLSANYSNSEWTLDGDEYSGLTWLSDTPKPTQAELDAAWPDVQAKIAAEADAKVATRASALAKLAALGLTEAEVNAIIGGV